jgi:hypothetical protein
VSILVSLGLNGKNFSQTYRERDEEVVKKILVRVLGEMRKLYEQTEKDERAPLAQFYNLGRTRRMKEKTRKQFRKIVRTKKCLVHGDFHSENIFLGERFLENPNAKNASVYLLDLESVSESHYLRDFVALETSVRINLMDWKIAKEADDAIKAVECNWLNDEKTRIRETRKIVEPVVIKWLTIEDRQASTITDRELLKAQVAIRAIRAVARELATGLGMSNEQFSREYSLGLIWYLYKYIDFEDISTVKKRYATEFLARAQSLEKTSSNEWK